MSEVIYQNEYVTVYEDGLVTWSNGVIAGRVYKEVDGHYVYVYEGCRDGFWTSHTLREIAQALDTLNHDWDQEIKTFFEKEEDEE